MSILFWLVGYLLRLESAYFCGLGCRLLRCGFLYATSERCAHLAPDVIGQDRAEATWKIEKAVRKNFQWQRFLSKGRLKQHAADFVQAVAKSTLPFVQYEVARIADRKDPFARRIFLTSLCDNRTRMHLQEFRVSRAYIFLNAYQSRT